MILALVLTAVGGVSVAGIARRVAVSPALTVVLTAGVVSFAFPRPVLTLAPGVALGVVVPPLLYATTLDLPFAVLRRHLEEVALLGIGAVFATAAVIGVLADRLEPGLGVSGALVLGAVVAPPDSVTTAGDGRALGLPARVRAVLTGESLVNDAAALTLFGIATAVVTGGSTLSGSPVLLFLYAAGVAIAVGVVLGLVVARARRLLRDPTTSTVLGVLTPFLAYQLASRLQASGVLAVVAAGFVLSRERYLPSRPGPAYRERLQEVAVWPVLNALLESFTFAYIGLQLHPVVQRVAAGDQSALTVVGLALSILVLVMLVRVVWIARVFGRHAIMRRVVAAVLRTASRWTGRARGAARDPASDRGSTHLTARELTLVSWAGMRGVVTLAAASAIPLTAHGRPFPERSTIQVVAFVVVLGTLVLQGSTLRVVARRLRFDLSDEEAAERAEWQRGQALLSEVPETSFALRRAALGRAVIGGELGHEMARNLIRTVDLAEADHHARGRTSAER